MKSTLLSEVIISSRIYPKTTRPLSFPPPDEGFHLNSIPFLGCLE